MWGLQTEFHCGLTKVYSKKKCCVLKESGVVTVIFVGQEITLTNSLKNLRGFPITYNCYRLVSLLRPKSAEPHNCVLFNSWIVFFRPTTVNVFICRCDRKCTVDRITETIFGAFAAESYRNMLITMIVFLCIHIKIQERLNEFSLNLL